MSETNKRGLIKTKYKSIIKDGKIVMPKIVKHDISWELLMGMEYISDPRQNQYLLTKRTPWNT
jgi:hypothetical protein